MSELKNVLTIGRYLKIKFGEKVYKVPISISGFTCPNIDGTVARGGCSFCENDSFSPNLQEKKTKFKLNPRVAENPYLENQLINSNDLSFIHRGQVLKLRLSGYYNNISNSTEISRYFKRLCY